jgi:hypothetical protein
MVAYYDGDTKVSEEVYKELKLPANANGADFGEIENKQAGKKMLVYVRDNNPADDETVVTPGTDAPADPNATTPTDPNAGTTADEKTGNNMIIIIAAAAAVVVIAVVVVVIVASKKKKTAPKTEEKTEE